MENSKKEKVLYFDFNQDLLRIGTTKGFRLLSTQPLEHLQFYPVDETTGGVTRVEVQENLALIVKKNKPSTVFAI